MAYIDVDKTVPGIRSLVLFRPETGKPLYELAQILLRGESPLNPAERELIAAYVSHRNECGFCRDSHAAAARCLYGEDRGVVDELLSAQNTASLSVKMQALLHLAGKVQAGGHTVTKDDITAAAAAGANDQDIHDTVLIAATFSLFNRYVDGLGSLTPTDPAEYAVMGERLSKHGYVPPAAAAAYIDFKNDLPGIRGPMIYRPETGKPLNELAEILLHDENNTLSRGERELIAAFVSSENDCFFCQNVHGAMAQFYFGWDMPFLDAIKKDYLSAPISDKLKSLLSIAGSVRHGGKQVTPEQIEQARSLGVTDREIHDTVLIAAAFCMFNRYVDGLNTWAPPDRQVYVDRAKTRAEEGYSQATLR